MISQISTNTNLKKPTINRNAHDRVYICSNCGRVYWRDEIPWKKHKLTCRCGSKDFDVIRSVEDYYGRSK